MKEITIIIIILIIIFCGALYTRKYLNKTTDMLVSKLEDLKTCIEEDKIGEEELKQKSDDIYGEWKKIDEKWSVIVLHDEIDLIETALIKMKSKIKIGEVQQSMEDLDTSIFLVKHIKEKEETSLKNIF